ncbi:bifunctional adenosylcobinamide kinase/adenosylcobinamide-phosphate guanylyltransferase [Argonema galeatum]|uniref:bifunctional adenosylcobinamide kinase/adenosylcobinamide-phosphate guanylyltransferase n=1 Tax=Argonema galeatum TaxID=2942762 RepID=UPI0020124712|nr:bifunctional adenosylcobinamide kinase/adenosylcobinamide-phosphate guanylyltransferase [Argonema galeatum]MCL1464064.1 bifunctional adenosylcobinamide kinase/adenosylcobinamide-phosphate guanylyltransferase [Argonema galeatum A003/A1]
MRSIVTQAAQKRVILVTGPARSGKSEWAETLAIESGKPVIYVATANLDPTDSEWQHRIEQHQHRRPPDWRTVEVPVDLGATIQQATDRSCLLIDSLGTWVANLLEQDEAAWDKTLQELLEYIENCVGDLIFVAEETGWGVVPAYPVGRLFRDRLGMLVRRVGARADPVYLITGGHVLNLSILGNRLTP